MGQVSRSRAAQIRGWLRAFIFRFLKQVSDFFVMDYIASTFPSDRPFAS
jgi:hypothetical protein